MTDINTYIQQARGQGITDEQIKQNLLASGWTEEQISNTFRRGSQTSQNASGSKLKLIIIALVGMTILVGLIWAYSSVLFRSLGIKEDDQTLPTTSLPPLTEEQKQEAITTPEGMVYVPAGEYLSGAPSWDSYANVWPETKVYLDSFFIDKYEVTNSQYQEFVLNHPDWQKGAVARELAGRDYLSDFDGTAAPNDKLDHPVAWVSWYAADAYCRSVGKRLLTSAEWEKAARGTDGRSYPWGDKLESGRANFCDSSCHWDWRDSRFNDGFPRTSPVGSFPKGVSPYGVFDMTGNVLEWLSDWRDKSDAYYKQLPSKNPGGPISGERKVQRGGSWLNTDVVTGLKVYVYYSQTPAAVLNYVGFRCAKDVQ